MSEVKTQRETILAIKDLVVEYEVKDDNNVRAVDHVSLDLKRGEVLGLVGESGCGKSTLGFSLIGLLKGGSIKSGEVLLDGEKISNLMRQEYKKIRGPEISAIFQASQNVLNPTQKVINHFIDTYKAHGEWNKDRMEDIKQILNRLDISPSRLDDYPFQFSGGMQQRIVIALSLILNPKLLIADEPTTALDVLVQAKILKLLRELKEELDLTMILISHDLGVVAENSSRVAIMYAGQIVELASAKSIFKNPKHPYTEALIEAIPDVKDFEKKQQKSIPGSPPDLKNPPSGCRFANRCKYALPICKETAVDLIVLGEENGVERKTRCLKYYDEYQSEFKEVAK